MFKEYGNWVSRNLLVAQTLQKWKERGNHAFEMHILFQDSPKFHIFQICASGTIAGLGIWNTMVKVGIRCIKFKEEGKGAPGRNWRGESCNRDSLSGGASSSVSKSCIKWCR